MLCYFHHYQDGGKTDIYQLLEKLEEVDPKKADFWRNIFDHWFYAITDLPQNNTTLPEDLPQDDSLCIMVLGYRLHPTGIMEPELIGRLALALQAAQQYPNAWIVCTGGGTASEAPGITEAQQMARWLRQQGIDSSRILVESRSYHTIQNAQFSFQILTRDYPQITSLVLVTSDYHLPRSSILFYAQTLLTASETGSEPIAIAAYLGFEAGHEGVSEDPLDQTAHVARLCGFEYEIAEAPTLSRLTELVIQTDSVLPVGQALPLTVTALYDSGYSRDVTGECQISGFDPQHSGTQMLTVTYAENGKQIVSTQEIRRPAPETTPPETEPAAEPPETTPEESGSESHTSAAVWLLPAAAVIAAILLIILIRKKQ